MIRTNCQFVNPNWIIPVKRLCAGRGVRKKWRRSLSKASFDAECKMQIDKDGSKVSAAELENNGALGQQQSQRIDSRWIYKIIRHRSERRQKAHQIFYLPSFWCIKYEFCSTQGSILTPPQRSIHFAICQHQALQLLDNYISDSSKVPKLTNICTPVWNLRLTWLYSAPTLAKHA